MFFNNSLQLKVGQGKFYPCLELKNIVILGFD